MNEIEMEQVASTREDHAARGHNLIHQAVMIPAAQAAVQVAQIGADLPESERRNAMATAAANRIKSAMNTRDANETKDLKHERNVNEGFSKSPTWNESNVV